MQILDTLAYTNEQMMTFEAFMTKLNKAYNTLAKQGQHYINNVKVDVLAKCIEMPNNMTVGIALENMHNNYRNDFNDAKQFLKAQMAEINVIQQNVAGNQRRVSNVLKNPSNWNGVDIVNPGHNFIPKEWEKLGLKG